MNNEIDVRPSFTVMERLRHEGGGRVRVGGRGGLKGQEGAKGVGWVLIFGSSQQERPR